MTLQIFLITISILVIHHASCMFQFNPTLVPESEVERLAEIEPGSVNSKYFTDASLGIRRVGLSKVRLVCHATAKCPQNNHYINTKSSCHRQGCCYKNGECFQHAWYILKLCPSGSHCKEHCEQNNLCNGGTCVEQADSPGYSCTCPFGTCGDNCERSSNCFGFSPIPFVKIYSEAAAMCDSASSGIASRVLGSDGSGYHAKITTFADTLFDNKYWVGIQGDTTEAAYLFTDTSENAESGLVFAWDGVPDYPTAGEKCVYLDTSDNLLKTDLCSQEHYALCMFDI